MTAAASNTVRFQWRGVQYRFNAETKEVCAKAKGAKEWRHIADPNPRFVYLCEQQRVAQSMRKQQQS